MSAIRDNLLFLTGFGRYRHARVPSFSFRGEDPIISPVVAIEQARGKMEKIYMLGGVVAAVYVVAGMLAYATYGVADEVPFVIDGGIFGCLVPRELGGEGQ